MAIVSFATNRRGEPGSRAVRAVELSVDGISAKQLRRSGSIAARAARHALFRAREARAREAL
jgi:hypothetical protein